MNKLLHKTGIVKGGYLPMSVDEFRDTYNKLETPESMRSTLLQMSLRLLDPELTKYDADRIRVYMDLVKKHLKERDRALLRTTKGEIKSLKSVEKIMKEHRKGDMSTSKDEITKLDEAIDELKKRRRELKLKKIMTPKEVIWQKMLDHQGDTVPTARDLYPEHIKEAPVVLNDVVMKEVKT